MDMDIYLYTEVASKLFRNGVSEMDLQTLLNKFGEPLPKAISDVRERHYVQVVAH